MRSPLLVKELRTAEPNTKGMQLQILFLPQKAPNAIRIADLGQQSCNATKEDAYDLKVPFDLLVLSTPTS